VNNDSTVTVTSYTSRQTRRGKNGEKRAVKTSRRKAGSLLVSLGRQGRDVQAFFKRFKRNTWRVRKKVPIFRRILRRLASGRSRVTSRKTVKEPRKVIASKSAEEQGNEGQPVRYCRNFYGQERKTGGRGVAQGVSGDDFSA